MAKPPEPLVEVLPQATLIVVASVKRVVSTGAKLPPLPATEEPIVDRGAKSPEQVLVLEVERVLFGKHDGELQVTKPIAPYSVKEGTRGAWLLDDAKNVLGRYGPDSYRASDIEHALKQQQ